jgi:hypothetical protein
MPLYVLFLNFDIVVDEMVVFTYRRKSFCFKFRHGGCRHSSCICLVELWWIIEPWISCYFDFFSVCKSDMFLSAFLYHICMSFTIMNLYLICYFCCAIQFSVFGLFWKPFLWSQMLRFSLNYYKFSYVLCNSFTS